MMLNNRSSVLESREARLGWLNLIFCLVEIQRLCNSNKGHFRRMGVSFVISRKGMREVVQKNRDGRGGGLCG